VTAALVVGLTGGIGSGKSAVCREFERLGVPVIDADIVAREVVAPGTDGLAAVVARFGDDILAADGTLDRSRLRALVFADDAERGALEAMLHPRIRDRIGAQLAAVSTPYCILCIPLLLEKGGYKNVDRILLVDCPVETQITRVMARDNLTRPQVEAIMRSQATREDRLKIADDVVENSGGLEALRAPVEALHAKYSQIARQLNQQRAD